MASNQNQEQLNREPPAAEEDYEHLLEDYSHFAPPAEGEILQGTVLKVTSKEVIVDFGYKSEGLVPIEQFQGPDGEVRVQPGDAIDVMIDHGERPEGYVLLSYEKAFRIRVWDNLEKAYQQQLTIAGRVLGRVRGGLSVDVGVEAFMPGSQVDPHPIHNLDAFIGQDIPVKVVKVNRRRGNVVVSRKAAVMEEVEQRRAITLQTLAEGAVVTGVVKNLTDYGAFVDLGGIDGLLHVTDMSYSRVGHPSELVHPGDEITVKVLKFDKEKGRVSLGMKQLEPGVEALIHVSEITWSRRMKHPSKVVKPGDQVEAVVLDLHPRERRISLGLKQLEPNPWSTIEERYSIGSVVEGRVRSMTDFGAFIEIEEGIDGLVHVSDLSWTKRFKHPSEVLKKGQIVQAVILAIDSKAKRLSLGIKQLQPDAWESFFAAHQVGDMVRGRVSRIANFGVFVELAEGVEGLCHNSEIPGYVPRKNEEPPLGVGEEYDFKIVKMNEAEKKIGLSLKAITEDEERTRLEDYQRQAAAATTTIEEVMSLKDRGDENS